MLQNDTGPWGMFERLQAWYWTEPHRIGGLKDMFRCFYCLSFWVSMIVALSLIPIMHSLWEIPVYVFGLSGGAVIINIIHEKYNSGD